MRFMLWRILEKFRKVEVRADLLYTYVRSLVLSTKCAVQNITCEDTEVTKCDGDGVFVEGSSIINIDAGPYDERVFLLLA